MSSSGTSSPPPAAPEAASSPGPPPQAPPSPAGQPAGEGVTPPAGALTEVRLVGGGRVATRLAPHNTPTASPLLPRDDGYCSSDSTPKAAGERRVAGVLPLPRGPLTTTPDAPQGERTASDGDSGVGENVPVAAVAPRTPTAAQGGCGAPPGSPVPPGVGGGVPDDGRESWGKSMDFLLSIIGFAVDLANVWRFPFLCYRNGGGAFLLPYFLITVFGALPLFFMELVLGQYNRQGPITVWKICPFFRGVGYCAVLVAYFVSFYYNVIIAWSIYFVYASFSFTLPWTSCNNTWNTKDCWDGLTSEEPRPNISRLMSPSEEYFNNVVLQLHKSDGFDDLGPPQPGLVVCGIITYFILYLSLFKGVKSSGKVVWVTATMPYVILTLLLIRGALLPGAADGLLYYIKPSISALSDPKVWYEAAVQVFFSVGAGFGVHLAYASYNTFNNNCYRDCLITSVVNAFTSFYSGLVIFTYLGYMAFKQKTEISEVAIDGPGLVFQVYPEAVATLPGSQVWSCLFFLMLIALGLDSGMGGLECVITGLMDELQRTFGRRVIRREVFTALVVGSSFLVSITNFCQGGIYVFHWLDTYSAGISLLCSALFEAVAVSWFYGLRRFCADIQHMLGFRPRLYWRVCWKFVSPLFILITILIGLQIQMSDHLEYNGPTIYQYPRWAEAVGWCVTASSMAMIPLWMVISMCRRRGTCKEKFLLSLTPEEEHQKVLQTGDAPCLEWSHWLYI
ncbi:sodium-dependent dopamine transporter-like isoform X2 [Eriocheir sinensis]|uniref:sodium-dependent dopamine transporter-like isoform X2 n=1 Tax=Eriocheir sinensis TaxID=95602 RepID=UPI0021C8A2AF|nr:sodium-dependent dopamine transporter-like isoform X2 [Eriocheir sinensis]